MRSTSPTVGKHWFIVSEDGFLLDHHGGMGRSYNADLQYGKAVEKSTTNIPGRFRGLEQRGLAAETPDRHEARDTNGRVEGTMITVTGAPQIERGRRCEGQGSRQ